MTADEHKAAAENLTAAIKNNTNGAYDEWVSKGADLKDPVAQAAFVQKHAGLTSSPTQTDLRAINQHVRNALQNDIAAIQAQNPGAHVVGEMCYAED